MKKFVDRMKQLGQSMPPNAVSMEIQKAIRKFEEEEKQFIHGTNMVENYGLSEKAILAAKRTAWGSNTEMQVFAIGFEHGYLVAKEEMNEVSKRVD